MRTWGSRVAVFLIALSLAFAAEPPPAAPAGFSWLRLAEIRADLLKPSGWTLTHQRKGDSETYRLSGPKTGGVPGPTLEINWVPDVPRKAAMSPSKYAAALADTAAENHSILERSQDTQASFATRSFRFQDSGPGRDGLMVRYQLFSNDQTGSLYITAFEAPAKDWTNAWKTGRVLLGKIRLDPGL